jgi:hypothetical protein
MFQIDNHLGTFVCIGVDYRLANLGRMETMRRESHNSLVLSVCSVCITIAIYFHSEAPMETYHRDDRFQRPIESWRPDEALKTKTIMRVQGAIPMNG